MIKTLFQKIGAGALTMLVPALVWAQDKAKWNLQEPHTSVAREMYDLHTIVLVICLIIFVGVFGAMFYSVIYHRKSVGHKAAHFHENTTVEILWTVIPFFILIGMAWPATQSVLAMRDTSSPDMTIKVTGYQWKWGYEYLKGEGDLAGVADGCSALQCARLRRMTRSTEMRRRASTICWKWTTRLWCRWARKCAY